MLIMQVLASNDERIMQAGRIQLSLQCRMRHASRARRSELERFMILSRDRILTTHVGSLPRNEKLSDLLVAQEAGEA